MHLIWINSSCWCLSGGLLWGLCCVCTLRSFYQSSEFISQGLCPGLHTGNNNSYGCSRHTPTPPGPPKTYVCQSHSIHIPNLSFLHPAHPHDTHTAPLLFIILLLCNCLDDNALHIMARHGTIDEPNGDNLFTWPTQCPAKYQWCMHIVWIQCIPCFCRSLVTPSCSCAQITKSCSRVISIHLCVYNVCDEDESNENVAEQITEKNPVFPVLGFKLFSPVS